jgi:hypothetical protein
MKIILTLTLSFSRRGNPFSLTRKGNPPLPNRERAG